MKHRLGAAALAIVGAAFTRGAGAAAGAAAPSTGTTAVVCIAEAPGPNSELVALAVDFRAALAARIGGVLSRDETKARMLLERRGPGFADWDRQFEAARARLQRGDYAGGIGAMRAAIEELERAFGTEGAFPRWTRATLQLARAEDTLGHKDEARAQMDRLLRADPNAVADPDLFPPSFVEKFEKVRSALRALPHRRVAIGTEESAQARIFVEGRDLGLTSAIVSLAPGRYAVQVVVGDVRLPVRIVEVGSEDLKVWIDTRLVDAVRPEDGPGIVSDPAQREERMSALAGWLGVDRVYFLDLAGTGKGQYLSATAYDAKTSAVTGEGRLRLSGAAPPPGGVAALAALLALGESSVLVDLGLVTASSKTKDAERAVGQGTVEPTGGFQRVPGQVVLHYFRPDGRYNPWGLYVWLKGANWYRPIPPSGADDFGVYWLLDAKDFEDGRVKYIIHKGETKDLCNPDWAAEPQRYMSWSIRESAEAWTNTGDCNVYLSKEDALKARK